MLHGKNETKEKLRIRKMLLYQKAAIEKFYQIIGGCRKFHGGEEERWGRMRDGVFEQ